jgi:hypothetical protein
VPGVSGAVRVAVGVSHQCALLEDGTVACWSAANPAEPEQEVVELVSGLGDVQKLAMGSNHHCALQGDATLWCWGSNRQGELGQGPDSETSSALAVPVAGLGGVVDFDLSGNGSCAVTGNGSVHCWGSVQYTLASEDWPNPGNTVAWAPSLVPYVADAVSMSTGGAVSCVRTASEQVHCWGHPRMVVPATGTSTMLSTTVATRSYGKGSDSVIRSPTHCTQSACTTHTDQSVGGSRHRAP